MRLGIVILTYILKFQGEKMFLFFLYLVLKYKSDNTKRIDNIYGVHHFLSIT